MKFNIALIRGDGIGPEIVDSTVRVLEKVADRFGHEFVFTPYLAGGCAIDATGVPLPQETIDGCKASDSVLLGAVGGPKWDSQPANNRPERALLGLRSALGLFTNLRPAKIYPALASACTLRQDIVEKGFDPNWARDVLHSIMAPYWVSVAKTEPTLQAALIQVEYMRDHVVPRLCAQNVVSIDKANVLESSRLWRETVNRIAEEYPEVALDHMYVDNAAMQLVREPSRFDVVLTSNMFGDILSDEASQITGSIGLLASASLGDSSCGMYEPIHGSAPDIAGTGKANPIATILSGAMMLRYSFGLGAEADAIEKAVNDTLEAGVRTADIAKGGAFVDTTGMTDAILERL